VIAGFRDGLRAGVPYALAVGGFGVSFGVLARAVGMGIAAPIVMSATTFAGSAQFAAVSVLDGGGGVATAVVAAVLLNLRYGPMGVSVAPAMTGPWWRRFVSAQLVVDESWAVGQTEPGRFDVGKVFGVGLALYGAWLLGTLVGVLGGEALGRPESLGLDGAFPALFLALLVPQLRSASATTAAVVGGAIALALVPLTRPGVPIVCAALGCLAGLAVRRE
jgi:4-azaleucine resistance transporter AzlC